MKSFEPAPPDASDPLAASDDDLMKRIRLAERDLPDAPPWLVAAAIAGWRPPPVARPLRQRIEALLTFDSWAAQAVPALRAGRPTTRHYLFNAAGMDIDVQVKPSAAANPAAARFTVAGQVLGPLPGGEISLARYGVDIATVVLDDFGEFTFDDLSPGRCVMTLRLGGDDIVLPAFDVGAPTPG